MLAQPLVKMSIVTPHDSNIFQGSLCYYLPLKKPAAPTPYKDGTFLVTLSGPGSDVSTGYLTNRIKAKLPQSCKVDFKVIQSDSFIERILIPTKLDDPNNKALENLSFGFTTAQGKRVNVLIHDPMIKRFQFCVDWVPISVPQRVVKEMIGSFCKVEKISQDENPTRYYISTSSPSDKVPYWIHTSNLIASDETLRSLKVTIKGRPQMCLYCKSFEHPWFKCPNKKEVKKQRKLVHQQRWQNKDEEQQPMKTAHSEKEPKQSSRSPFPDVELNFRRRQKNSNIPKPTPKKQKLEEKEIPRQGEITTKTNESDSLLSIQDSPRKSLQSSSSISTLEPSPVHVRPKDPINAQLPPEFRKYEPQERMVISESYQEQRRLMFEEFKKMDEEHARRKEKERKESIANRGSWRLPKDWNKEP